MLPGLVPGALFEMPSWQDPANLPAMSFWSAVSQWAMLRQLVHHILASTCFYCHLSTLLQHTRTNPIPSNPNTSTYLIQSNLIYLRNSHEPLPPAKPTVDPSRTGSNSKELFIFFLSAPSQPTQILWWAYPAYSKIGDMAIQNGNSKNSVWKRQKDGCMMDVIWYAYEEDMIRVWSWTHVESFSDLVLLWDSLGVKDQTA